MGTIKDKNGRDLVDAEEIRMRWKEYREELYQKDLNEPDYYNGVVRHPEPDTLECKVKWALRSIAVSKASRCDEILAELFRSLMKPSRFCFHYVSKSRWPRSGLRNGKSQSSSQFPRRVKVKVKLLSCVRLFATPWMVAYQAPLSIGFSRQECWSRLPFPSPGDLPHPGIEPRSPTLQPDALLSEPPGKPLQEG